MIITMIEQIKERLCCNQKNVITVSNALINLEKPEESPMIQEIIRIMVLNPDNCLRTPRGFPQITLFTIYFNKLPEPNLTKITILTKFDWEARCQSSEKLPSATTYFTYNYNLVGPKPPLHIITIFNYSSPIFPTRPNMSVPNSIYEKEFHESMLARFKTDLDRPRPFLPRSYQLSKEFFPLPIQGGHFSGSYSVRYADGILFDFANFLHREKAIPKVFIHGYIKKSAVEFTGYKVILAEEKLSHEIEEDDQLIFILVSQMNAPHKVPEVEISGPISDLVRPRLIPSEGAAAMYIPLAASMPPRPAPSAGAAAMRDSFGYPITAPITPAIPQRAVASVASQTEPDNACNICFENKINAAIIPCGHTGCFSCLEKIKSSGGNNCPDCRVVIERILKLFI